MLKLVLGVVGEGSRWISCIWCFSYLVFPLEIFSLGSCVESDVSEQMFKLPPVNLGCWSCLGLRCFSVVSKQESAYEHLPRDILMEFSLWIRHLGIHTLFQLEPWISSCSLPILLRSSERFCDWMVQTECELASLHAGCMLILIFVWFYFVLCS